MKEALNQINIRTILPEDNAGIANVIRTTLKEFGADKPGTVYYDTTTDALYELFQKEGAIYHIAEADGKVVGGGGIYPSSGLPAGTCELVKMYLLKEARSLGLGKLLIQKSLEFAKKAAYKNVYLETMPELKQALKTYEKFGFNYINAPMGDTGHFGCDLWMLKEL